MPQTMVEAFARGLVDKIMLEALDVLDTDAADADEMMLDTVNVFETSAADEKHCASEDENAESMSETESSHIDVEAQIHGESGADYSSYSQQEAAAVIAKMVCGLRNVHIGDSSYVFPPVLSNLERQVKKAAAAIELSSALGHISNPPESRAPQGQGDVDQAMQNAVFDAAIELEPSSTTQRKDKEASGSEATKVSLSLLHRMIEDLQTESTLKPDSPPPVKDIAHWEEEQETFVRLIDCDNSKSHENEDLSFLDQTPSHSKQSVSPANSSGSIQDIVDDLPPPEPISIYTDEDRRSSSDLPQENLRTTLTTSLLSVGHPEDAIDRTSLSEQETDSARQTKADCFTDVPIERSPVPSPPRSPPSPPPDQPLPAPGPSDILLDAQRDSAGGKRKGKRRGLFSKAKRLLSAAFRRRAR